MSDLIDIALLGWAAGAIDGEGTIGVYLHKGHYRLTLAVYNTDPRMVLQLQELFGGSTHTYNNSNKKGRPYFVWIQRAQQARQTLEILLPFFVIKKEQALLAIEFSSIVNTSTGRGHKVSEVILARHSALADKLKQLKQIEFPQDSIFEDGSWPHTTLKSVHPGEPTPITRED